MSVKMVCVMSSVIALFLLTKFVVRLIGTPWITIRVTALLANFVRVPDWSLRDFCGDLSGVPRSTRIFSCRAQRLRRDGLDRHWRVDFRTSGKISVEPCVGCISMLVRGE